MKRYHKHFPEMDQEQFLKTVNREWQEAGACYVGNSYVFGDVDDRAAELGTLGVYARNLGASFIEPLYAQPYPGTPYREELKRRDLLPDCDWSRFTEGRLLVKHPELDEERLKALRVKMWLDFYSPRRAGMQMRLPLFLHRQVGVPRRRISQFVKKSQKSMFGCLLEDKFYAGQYGEMVETYFRETFPTFEPAELDMSENFEAYLDLLGQGHLKRLLNNRDLLVNIVEHGEVLATFVTSIRDRRVTAAFAHPGAYGPPARFVTMAIPLRVLKTRLTSSHPLAGAAAVLEGLCHNLIFGWRYRRLARRAASGGPARETVSGPTAT